MSANEALKSLHATLVDAEKGYETAVADADAPEIKFLFERMQTLHARAHAEVHAWLMEAGENPDDSGSVLALVHKTVISVRAAVKGLDRTSLPSFIDGEQRIVAAYDRAIAEGCDTAALRAQRDALVRAVAEMKAKAA